MVIDYVDEDTFTLRTIGRQVDGELMGDTPLDVRIVPSAGGVLVPKK